MKFVIDSSLPIIVILSSVANSKDSGVLSGSVGTGEGGLSFKRKREHLQVLSINSIHKFSSVHNSHLY